MRDKFLLRGGAVSKAAFSAGLGDRFRYWTGASGRAYLFTRVAAADLVGFREAVVLTAVRGREGVLTGRTVVAMDACGQPRPAPAEGDEVFVHLLARGAAARASVLADLTATVIANAA